MARACAHCRGIWGTHHIGCPNRRFRATRGEWLLLRMAITASIMVAALFCR